MPNASARCSSTTIASIDFFHNSSSGEPRLMRYELCAIGCVTRNSSSAPPNAAQSASVIGLARHWLLFLVHNCTQSQPAAWAARTALW